MTITFKSFQEQSKRTMPFEGHCQNTQELYNVLGNYSLGVLGEWMEFQHELKEVKLDEEPTIVTVDKIEKEIGDIAHYLVGLLTIMQEEFDEKRLSFVLSEDLIYEDLSNVGEIPKKYIYHGHQVDEKKFVDSIYKVISFLQTNFGRNMDRILQKNIDKLKLRYPNKFTTADSIKRKDVK